jgi:hypothetical protein
VGLGALGGVGEAELPVAVLWALAWGFWDCGRY